MTTGTIAITGRAGPCTLHTARSGSDAVLALCLLDAHGRTCAEVERHYRGPGAETFARNDQRALVIGTLLNVHASAWRVDTVPQPRLVLGGQVHWQPAPAHGTAAPADPQPAAPAGGAPGDAEQKQPPRRRAHETTTSA